MPNCCLKEGENERDAWTDAYGLKPDTPNPEIVAHLFGLYANLTRKGAI